MRTAPTRTPPIRLADIPDVARPAALHGSLSRAEVGSSYCFGIIVTTSLV
jgi:hypothetical protein